MKLTPIKHEMCTFAGSGQWNAQSTTDTSEFFIGYDGVTSTYNSRLIFTIPESQAQSKYEILVKLQCIPPSNENKILLSYAKAYFSAVNSIPPTWDNKFNALKNNNICSVFYTDESCSTKAEIKNNYYSWTDSPYLYLKFEVDQITPGSTYYIYLIPHIEETQTIEEDIYVQTSGGNSRLWTEWKNSEGYLEITLTPKSYTITYDGNNGISDKNEDVVEVGSSVKLPSGSRESDLSFLITGEGKGGKNKTITASYQYKLLGWSTNPSSEKAEYEAESNYTPKSDITLYAIWEGYYINNTIKDLGSTTRDSSKKNIVTTLDAGEGTISNKQLTSAETTTFNFKGWSQSQNSNQEILDENYFFTKEAIVYAVWEENKTYSSIELPRPTPPSDNILTFTVVGDGNGNGSQKEINATKRIVFSFNGWYLNNQIINSPYTPKGNTTLLAQYNQQTVFDTSIASLGNMTRDPKIETFIITGKVPEDLLGAKDTELKANKIFTYEFLGWGSEANSTTPLDKNSKIDKEIYYTIWEPSIGYENNQLSNLIIPEDGYKESERYYEAKFTSEYGNEPSSIQANINDWYTFSEWLTTKTEFYQDTEINASYEFSHEESKPIQLPNIIYSGKNLLYWEANDKMYAVNALVRLEDNTTFNAVWSSEPIPSTRIYIFTK